MWDMNVAYRRMQKNKKKLFDVGDWSIAIENKQYNWITGLNFESKYKWRQLKNLI